VERDYPFGSTDGAVNVLVSKIVKENNRVKAQGAKVGRKAYVRIAVFMPMTWADGGAMLPDEILHSLQGAYAAQVQANGGLPTELGDATPMVQLVLANEGTDESAWSTVVDRLAELKGGPHPLVAVTGMSISVPQTKAAADRLGALRIPSIAAVVTADDMVSPWLFKMSPSNRQYTEALKAYLAQQPELSNGYLVWDRNTDDSYVQKLKTAFMGAFGDIYGLAEHNHGFNGSKPPTAGTPQLFSEIVRNICGVNPDVVFFSGRDRDLPAFVKALGTRGQCQNPVRPLIIATGATGLTLAKDDLDAAKVGVLDASATDAVDWDANVKGTPSNYAAFSRQFTTGLGFTAADLSSGYAIMHRDAVAAAIWATRRDTVSIADRNAAQPSASPIPETPTAEDVRNALFGGDGDAIPAASGTMYFQEQPDNALWPVHKPVPIIRIGAVAQTWPADSPWSTTVTPIGD
jgi:ABC-type branched-subunit amino acid transport system substrate-binding protein